MDLPVTLVIKAPNQRVEDQTVDCMLGWTVKKLKQHLTDVYPNKPEEDNQRLIYSGKLLPDHVTLKEVLRQFDDNSNKHTVHLVCSSSPQAESGSQFFSSNLQSHSRQSSSSSTQSQTSAGSATENEGLRYRAHRNPSPPSQTYPQSIPTNNPNVFNQFGGNIPMQNQMQAGMMPDAAAMMFGNGAMTYTPEQYVWMQQMYAQYMAQYMQYYQQGMYQMSPNQMPNQTQAQANQPQNAGNDNEQDNADFVDDDEEFHQRDWLDYLYTFSRFMVLVGIVYFYSSVYRFLMVACVVVVIYAFHMGWFQARNNPRRQNQQAQEPRQPPPPQQPPSEQNDNTDESNPTDTPSPPPEPPAPGVLQVTWTFVSTFFTSLFPSPPPAVNAN